MQYPIRRRWSVWALAVLLGLALMVTVGWTAQALADPGGWDEQGLRTGMPGREQAVEEATAQDRSGSESIRQVPQATMPEPRLDHRRQFSGDESVPGQRPADPARPAQVGVQPSRIIALAILGLALVGGVVWVGRRRHPQARPTT